MLAGSGDRFVREGEREAKGAVDMKGEHEVSYQLDLFIICLQWSMAKPTQVTQLYGIKYTRSHTLVQSLRAKVNCIELNILIVTFHNSFAKCFL